MFAVGGVMFSAIKVIAVITHALGIVFPVWVWTVGNLHGFSFWIVFTYERVRNLFVFFLCLAIAIRELQKVNLLDLRDYLIYRVRFL